MTAQPWRCPYCHADSPGDPERRAEMLWLYDNARRVMATPLPDARHCDRCGDPHPVDAALAAIVALAGPEGIGEALVDARRAIAAVEADAGIRAPEHHQPDDADRQPGSSDALLDAGAIIDAIGELADDHLADLADAAELAAIGPAVTAAIDQMARQLHDQGHLWPDVAAALGVSERTAYRRWVDR
jgi:hypothetical protein